MKWLKYFAFLLSAVVLVACGGDDDEQKGGKENLTDVVFQVKFPSYNFVNQSAVETGTNGNGLKVDILKIGFYATDGSFNLEKEFMIGSESMDVLVSLALGKTYNVIFWAQNSECEFYDVSNLNMITMKNPAIASMEGIEKLDAFYGACKGVEVDEGGLIFDVEMKRPLAQINVGTTKSWKEIKFKLTDVPVAFSPLDGRVVAKSDLTFQNIVMPNKVAEFTADGQTYKYLGLAYVFAPMQKTDISCVLTIYEGKTETSYLLPLDIQVNHKSTILGDY